MKKIKKQKFSQNKNIYTKNLKALQNKYPEIYNRIINLKNTENYQLLNSKSKNKNLYIKDKNLYFYKNPDNLREELEEEFSKLTIKRAKLAIFLGLGLGYELFYYLNKEAKKNNTIKFLIVEKEIILFKKAIELFDFSNLINNNNYYFLVGENEANFFTLLSNYFRKTMTYIFLKSFNVIYHESSLLLNSYYYTNFIKRFKEAGSFIVLNFGNSPEDSIIGIENMLDNIIEIVKNPGINLLYNKFKGKPAIIASTGPSLNKNKHLLKGLEHKALIIAPDASLKPLLEIGVKPHMITALERVPMTVKLVEGYNKEEVENVYYAACPVVMKEAYENYPGPRLIVYRNFDHFKWLQTEKGTLDVKASAGNMAYKIASVLGCDPIILIGQDLAYAPDGKTHASGSTLGEIQGKNKKRKEFYVKGNIDEKILTNETWYQFLQGYEIDIAQNKGICINSTEGGAYIKGTEVMPFKNAINSYVFDVFNPLQIIKNELSNFRNTKINLDIKKILNIIDNTIVDMNNVYINCKKATNFYKNSKEELLLLKNTESYNFEQIKLINSFLTKVIQLKKDTISNKKNFQLFFMHIIQSFHLNFEINMNELYSFYKDINKANLFVTLNHQKWFATIGNIAHISIGLLNKAKNKLNNQLIKIEKEKLEE